MAEPLKIDLEALALRSGEAERLEIDLKPEAPLLGGEELPIESTPIGTLIDVSRTTSGYALRLRADAAVLATMRPLPRAGAARARDRRPRGRSERFG